MSDARSDPDVGPQDVLEFEGWFGRSSYEAVPAGRADEVVDRYRRRARRWVGYRVLGVVLAGLAATAVLFRFVEDLQIAGAVGLVGIVLGSAYQLRDLDQGVPDVVARDVDPNVVRREYGVDPASDDSER